MIAVADTIKPTSRAAVAEFKRMGIDVILLTGDNPQVAQAIAAQAGIDNVIAEVLPSDKQRVVSQVQAEGRKVAMIGDGINDAPALAQADVGIAIGAGTDVAIESADIVLMKSDLWDAVTAVKLSKAVLRNIKQNLFWALIYNSIGIPLAAGVFIPLLGWKLNPMFGAAAMSLSSVSVVSNALRLKLFSSPRPAGLPESSSAPAAQVAVQHIELKNKGEKNMTKTMIVKRNGLRSLQSPRRSCPQRRRRRRKSRGHAGRKESGRYLQPAGGRQRADPGRDRRGIRSRFRCVNESRCRPHPAAVKNGAGTDRRRNPDGRGRPLLH